MYDGSSLAVVYEVVIMPQRDVFSRKTASSAPLPRALSALTPVSDLVLQTLQPTCPCPRLQVCVFAHSPSCCSLAPGPSSPKTRTLI